MNYSRLLPASHNWYYRKRADGLVITNTRAEHAVQLEALQRAVFVTLSDAERFKAPHYLRHLEIFPEGQFVALNGAAVAGATTTLRLNFDFAHVQHTFADIIQGGWLSAHQPEGRWLYGADMGVHPDYRRRGVASDLYAARQELVHRLGLNGQVTVGMLHGYGAVRNKMSAAEYYEEVTSGRTRDPTLTMQMKAGFTPRGLLPNYLDDPVCGNYGVLLVLDAGSAIEKPGAIES